MLVPLTLTDFLDRAELVYGARAALVDEPDAPGGSLERITYRQLADMARSLSAALTELGVGAGERVAIVSPNSTRYLAAMFGVSGSGRILVPINFRLTTQEVVDILEDSGCRLALLDAEMAERLGELPVERAIILGSNTDQFLFGRAGGEIGGDIKETSVATLNYTSGTTSKPKGVQLTHRNIWLNATQFAWHLGISDRDVYLHTLPLFHVNGWGLPYALTAVGAGQIIIRKIDGEQILKRVETHGVTVMCCAPAVMASVLDAMDKRRAEGRPVPGRGSVRVVLAGAPPPSKLIERMETDLGWEPIQLWGLTETSPVLTFNRRRAEWDGLSPAERSKLIAQAGPPVVGVRLKVDETGELLARTNHAFSGYWRRPKATKAALSGGWFRTGDGGVLTDGYITINDRKKDVIITGGENVSSIEVEDCLYQHPAVAEVAVIGVPDKKWGETIKAVVVCKLGSTPDEADIISFCRARMAHFKCPTSVDFRGGLPRTATGKLQKFLIRQEYWAGYDRSVN